MRGSASRAASPRRSPGSRRVSRTSRVTPVEGVREFAFVIDATLVDDDSTLRVRVLSPNIGGALGARVDMVDVHGP